MLVAALSFLVTILVYQSSKWLYKRYPLVFLFPIITSVLTMIVFLIVSRTPYSHYMSGAKWLSDLLAPATVAFAIPLHKHFDLLRSHAVEIVGSVFTGAFTSIVSTVLLADTLHFNAQLAGSLAPRSVTTPIAMQISQTIGGVPVLTAVFVILTAFIGILVGPIVIRFLHIQSSIAKGTLFGTGAHGIGTSKAFELGALEGTIASLAMIISAGFTVVLAPFLVPFLVHYFHSL